MSDVRVIVLASRKGGAGKTTLAAHLAVEAQNNGVGPVVIIDTDPMPGGLAGWWNARKAETPAFDEIGEGGLQATLARLQERGAKLVIIDTPPAADQAIGHIIAAASLVVVPVIPSPNDLRAIGETLDLVEGRGRGLVFVLNNVAPRARLTHEASSELSQYGTVAPVAITTRQDFRSSMIDGRTVGEVKGSSKSAGEVKALWAYIDGRLNGVRHAVAAA